MTAPQPPPGLSAADRREWSYIYLERIGISCPEGEPTAEQIAYARSEADKAVA